MSRNIKSIIKPKERAPNVYRTFVNSLGAGGLGHSTRLRSSYKDVTKVSCTVYLKNNMYNRN